MKPYILGFTLDTISKVAFGLETACYKREKNEFAQICQNAIDEFEIQGWIGSFFFQLVAHFPNLMVYIPFWPDAALKLGQITHDTIEERTKKNIERADFLGRLKEHKANLGKNFRMKGASIN